MLRGHVGIWVLASKKCIGEINKEDAVTAATHNDKKYNDLQTIYKASYALSDEEINDEELRRLTKFTTTDKNNKMPELGNMICIYYPSSELLVIW